MDSTRYEPPAHPERGIVAVALIKPLLSRCLGLLSEEQWSHSSCPTRMSLCEWENTICVVSSVFTFMFWFVYLYINGELQKKNEPWKQWTFKVGGSLWSSEKVCKGHSHSIQWKWVGLPPRKISFCRYTFSLFLFFLWFLPLTLKDCIFKKAY